MKKNITKKNMNLPAKEYAQFLEHIKYDIQQTQLRTAQSITRELTLLYWRIGKALAEKIKGEGWGSKVVDTLAHDLGRAFPGLAGFSRANIYRMVAFYRAYDNCRAAVRQIEDTPVLTIPWGHNIVLLEQLDDYDQRVWYAQKTIENGWSRSVLSMWIESNLYKRQGKSITNFKKTLPDADSDLAQQTLKDPYNFDFLTTQEQVREREIEQGLMQHIQKFLLELGQGFSFVGRQYHLQVGDTDFYIDMLFYHLKLRCFIVVELKAQAFDVRDVGQVNFYLSAVDSMLKHADDKPTIGLLLCKSKDNYVAEYALRDINKPIGISSYATKLVESLPKEFKDVLPSVAEIESELEKTKVKKNTVKTQKAPKKFKK